MPRQLGFATSVQLLADRGDAVLPVDFRGTTGYGKAFVEAAIGEFAGKMHDYVIDAVEWAVREGYVDRDRVDRIRTPLLVIQGADDIRVVRAGSGNLVDALRQRGAEVEYLVEDDQGTDS